MGMTKLPTISTARRAVYLPEGREKGGNHNTYREHVVVEKLTVVIKTGTCSRLCQNTPNERRYSPFLLLVSFADLNVERASSYFWTGASISYSPYTPSRMTFSAKTWLLLKAGKDACAGSGAFVMTLEAMVKAANAPVTAF